VEKAFWIASLIKFQIVVKHESQDSSAIPGEHRAGNFPGAQRELFRRHHIGGCSRREFGRIRPLARFCSKD
jgi:hypothetical protein